MTALWCNVSIYQDQSKYISKQLIEEAENVTKIAAYNETKDITHLTKGIKHTVEIRELVGGKRRAKRRWKQFRDPF